MSEELQEIINNNPEWYKCLQYKDAKGFIRDNINSASRSFVAIGYYLKYIRDNQSHKEDGYETIWEFAKGEFGIGKSSASQFMSINDKFSKDGNSPILLEQYKDFSSSKLAEMLTMTEEQLEQITPTTTTVEIRQIKKPTKTVLTSEQEPEPSGKCIHRPEFPCTLSEASKLAQGDGVNCNAKCCWNCSKHGQCGLECNSSVQRPVANNIPNIINDIHEDVDNEPEKVNDVDENVIETSEIVNEDQETVEADIIQTVPKQLPDPIWSAKKHLKDAIEREEGQIKEMREHWMAKNPDALLKHETILLALKMHLTDMEYPDPAPVEKIQPELPILKNNDQRKEFIEAYDTWPIWIDTKPTKERYYRYDFDNGSYIVVKVYFQKGYSWGELKNKDHWGSNEYYLIKAQGSHFKDCQTNMTALIEYLKDIQKK